MSSRRAHSARRGAERPHEIVQRRQLPRTPAAELHQRGDPARRRWPRRGVRGEEMILVTTPGTFDRTRNRADRKGGTNVILITTADLDSAVAPYARTLQ